MKTPLGFHRCPGVCENRLIPDSLYACVDCWFKLPGRAQRWISRTARFSVLHPDRRGAIEFARRMWNLYLIRQSAESDRTMERKVPDGG